MSAQEKKARHTPGPWQVWHRNGETARVEAPGAGHTVCAYADPSDARLIAQAPAMYELLRRVAVDEATFREWRDLPAWKRLQGGVTEEAWDARAILAAIEGES